MGSLHHYTYICILFNIICGTQTLTDEGKSIRYQKVIYFFALNFLQSICGVLMMMMHSLPLPPLRYVYTTKTAQEIFFIYD